MSCERRSVADQRKMSVAGADFSCGCAAASQHRKLQKDGAGVWCQLINIRVFMIHAAAVVLSHPVCVLNIQRCLGLVCATEKRSERSGKGERERRAKVTLHVHREPRDICSGPGRSATRS